MITADHGCDPDPAWPTTDHSREYVPILTYSPEGKHGVNLGVRDTLADMGQTIAENFGGAIPHGKSFLPNDCGLSRSGFRLFAFEFAFPDFYFKF
jgi:phosphopentomutase